VSKGANNQLRALLKARELEEQRALQRRSEVEIVFSERAKDCSKLEREIEEVDSEVSKLDGVDRLRAAQEGDALKLQAVCSYRSRMSRKAKKLKTSLLEKNVDLERARERLAIADGELAAARVEVRRIERLLENRVQEELVRGSAAEESAMDELANTRRFERRED